MGMLGGGGDSFPDWSLGDKSSRHVPRSGGVAGDMAQAVRSGSG